MSEIVIKFGGTSLATPELIINAAKKAAKTKEQYNRVVVVVSAMGSMTDELTSLAYKITSKPDQRELDMLLTVGERISMSLFSMALNSMGYPSISLTGSQSGIVTDTRHGNARIRNIEKERFLKHLDAGKIVIIAGYQGISYAKEITTLGRGGSDLTAVAIAATIGASQCDIYTDVEGVFTADPMIIKNARKIDVISDEEMMELSGSGAGVLYPRAMELARKNNIVIQIRSSFSENTGTFIKERDDMLEEVLVRAIACEENQSMIRIRAIPDRSENMQLVFRALADEDITIDMITKNVSDSGITDLSFTVGENDLDKTVNVTRGLLERVGAKEVTFKGDLAKVALVGIGMRSHSGVAALTFEELSKNDIDIEMITTSDIKISILIKSENVEKAVRVLHDVFELDKGGIKISRN